MVSHAELEIPPTLRVVRDDSVWGELPYPGPRERGPYASRMSTPNRRSPST